MNRDQGPTRKREQMASTIQRELQNTLARGLNDPRVRGLITVTEVELLEDLTEARIGISVMPDEHADLTLHGLKAAARHLRRQVGDRVRTRRLPDFVFRLDAQYKKQADVLGAIARANAESPIQEQAPAVHADPATNEPDGSNVAPDPEGDPQANDGGAR